MRQFIWAFDCSQAQALRFLSGVCGTPTRNFEISIYRADTTLHSNKDLAVSFPLFIPMAELSLLRWDGALLRLSPWDVSARTSMLTHGGRYPLLCSPLEFQKCCALRSFSGGVSGLSSPTLRRDCFLIHF